VRRGEIAVLGLVGAVAVAGVLRACVHPPSARDGEIPFYSTASPELAASAGDLIRRLDCRQCHSLWSTRDLTQAVPAPMLDGIGSLRSESWLYDYLSAPDPQSILASRLKPQYRMPSFAGLTQAERRTLSGYLASLQVKDWYLDQTRRLEHDKLTGEDTAEK
jgi:sulfur-oxidizing protein SoxX